MAMKTEAYWAGHFCVESGNLASDHAFLCRIMHFAAEPGRCFITIDEHL